jgi:hypothetical protein
MDYDEQFEALDELLTTINDAIQDMLGTSITDPVDPYFSYMFDKENSDFDDMETIVFPLSPMH